MLDELIMANWRRNVGPQDTLFHLGDVGRLDWISELPGVKSLVFGNLELSRTHCDIRSTGLFVMAEKRQILETDFGDVLLTHGHPKDKSTEPFWLVLHGHCHSGTRFWPDSRNLTVDTNNWGPIDMEDILSEARGQI